MSKPITTPSQQTYLENQTHLPTYGLMLACLLVSVQATANDAQRNTQLNQALKKVNTSADAIQTSKSAESMANEQSSTKVQALERSTEQAVDVTQANVSQSVTEKLRSDTSMSDAGSNLDDAPNQATAPSMLDKLEELSQSGGKINPDEILPAYHAQGEDEPDKQDTDTQAQQINVAPNKPQKTLLTHAETLSPLPTASQPQSEVAVAVEKPLAQKTLSNKPQPTKQQVPSETQTRVQKSDVHNNHAQSDDTQPDNADNSDDDKEAKSGFIKRMYDRLFGDEVGTVEKIVVITNIVDATDLVENVQKALSQVTVDEFGDYKVIIPRLRTIARDAAKAVGYYEASFVFEKLSPTALLVTIEPKTPVRIETNRIDIKGSGKTDTVLREVMVDHMLDAGDVFNSRQYDTLKNALMLEAQRRGYFDSRWETSSVNVYLPQNTANVSLVLNTGKRYRFGDVMYLDRTGGSYYVDDTETNSIAGNASQKGTQRNKARLQKSLFESIKPFKEDDWFEQQRLNQFTANLLATQYFNTVDIQVIKPEQKPTSSLTFSETSTAESTATPNKNENVTETSAGIQALRKKAFITKKSPIQVRLDDSKPNYAEIGLGFGTDSNFRIRGKLSRRLINRNGDKMTANMALSKIQQSLELSYTHPLGSPLDDTMTYFVGHSIEKRDSGLGIRDLRVQESKLGLQRQVYKYDWHHSFELQYELDQLEADFTDAEERNIPVQFNDSNNQQALLFGYGATRTSLQGGLNPYQGYKQSYKLQYASDKLLSDATFAKLRASLNGLYSFGEDNVSQVLASVNAGTLITSDFNNIPYNQRFFAGGDNSLRGYGYKTLSPEVDGYLVGGHHLLVGSLEYNRRFSDNWRWAVFTDIGNAYNDDFSNETKYSAGLGVRVKTPVGPLRVDVAAGLKENSIPIGLHFFIGPPF